ADDTVLIANNGEDTEKMSNESYQEINKLGMKINMKKTKLMYNEYAQALQVHIGSQEVEKVDDHVYLGQLVTMKNDKSDEIKRRIGAAWRTFGQYKHILQN